MQFWILVVLFAVAQAEQVPPQTQPIAFDMPDLSAKIKAEGGEALIEAFKALTNDRILDSQECRFQDRTSQLYWVSVGNPTLLKSMNNGTLQTIHKQIMGFYVYVDMLTAKHREILAESASMKYNVTVNPRQIMQMVLSRFECTIDLYEAGHRLIIKGRVRDFRSYPLRVDFNAPVGTLERRVLDRTLESGQHIDTECQINSETKLLRVNTLTVTVREMNALELPDKLFGLPNSLDKTLFFTRDQMKKLSAAVYNGLNVAEEFEIPQHQFTDIFVDEVVKQTAVTAFRLTPLNFTLSSLSRFGIDVNAEMQTDEMIRHLSNTIRITTTNNRTHLVVNQLYLNSVVHSTGTFTSINNYFSLFPLTLSTSFVTASHGEWSKGSRSLDSQLKELNVAVANEAEWAIENKRVVPKRLSVAKLSRRNFSRILTFSGIRRQFYDSAFVRTLMFYGFERPVEPTDGTFSNIALLNECNATLAKQLKEFYLAAERLKRLEARVDDIATDIYRIERPKSDQYGNKTLHTAPFQIFKSSTVVVVPTGKSKLYGVCIGGGAGGLSRGSNGGGGSGFIAYGIVIIASATSITITIGEGGAAGTNGSTSSIGSYITAPGGSIASSTTGGDGGSGGGCGTQYLGVSSCSGGTGGSDGNSGNNGSGGSGQGSSVWLAAASHLNLTNLTITFGDGGAGNSVGGPSIAPGGGGGGGILVNGVGISATSGGSPHGGGGGFGYGAGGGSSGCILTDCNYSAGAGAQGICLIAWV